MEFFNFKNAMVKSGSKTVDESYAQLELTSTFNVFKLNQTALAMMGIASGDRVVMFDTGMQSSGDDDRFFITAGFEDENGVEQGAKITGANRTFSYNKIYGAILKGDKNVISITPDTLIEEGLLYPKADNKSSQYVSTKTMVSKLVAHNDGEEVQITDTVFQKVFALTQMRFEDHTKREVSAVEAAEDLGIE
jgi:hypothetical protein